MLSIFLALIANISFATGTLFFTRFSHMASSSWMNWLKASVASIGFWIVFFILTVNSGGSVSALQQVSSTSLWLWVLSGSLGLFIGDIFLLKAFTHLGPGRTLMLFGFQPLLLGLASSVLFGQSFFNLKLLAIFFLMGSLFVISFGAMKENGHWGWAGLGLGALGILLDSVGVLLTRQAFELSPEVSPFLANAIRASAAAIGLSILSKAPPFQFSMLNPFYTWSRKNQILAVVASLLGTFVSLGCYLSAIKMGHIGTLSAIASTSPLFATLLEVLTGQKRNSRYLMAGCGLFALGLFFLFYFN